MLEVIGGYRILQKFGKSLNTGTWLAQDPRGPLRRVVLKTFPNSVSKKETFLSKEAEFLRGLRHPHLARLLDFGIDQGRLFAVWEFIDGNSLVEEASSRDWKSLFPFIAQAAWALGYLHEKALFGLELKASHFRVEKIPSPRPGVTGDSMPQLKIVDFIDANSESKNPALPNPQEQLQADLHSLGRVLEEMVRSKHQLPYSVEEKLQPEILAQAGVPRGVIEIIARLTHPDPGKQLQRANDLIRGLNYYEKENFPLQTPSEKTLDSAYSSSSGSHSTSNSSPKIIQENSFDAERMSHQVQFSSHNDSNNQVTEISPPVLTLEQDGLLRPDLEMEFVTKQALERWSDCSRRLLAQRDSEALFQEVLDGALALAGAEAGLLLVSEQGRLTVRAARNLDPESFHSEAMEFHRKLVAEAFRQDRLLVISDDGDGKENKENVGTHQLYIPFKLGTESPGMIYLEKQSGPTLGREVSFLLESFAAQAAAAFEQVQLHEENGRTIRELRESKAMLERLNHQLETALKLLTEAGLNDLRERGLDPQLADLEKKAILQALQSVKGNKVKAARLLKISRRTLYLKMKAFGIEPEFGKSPKKTAVL